jgi:hypothetical protein
MPVILNSVGIVFNDGTTHTTHPSQTSQKSNLASTNSDRSLSGDSGWVDHLGISFTTTVSGPVILWAQMSPTYESGAVDGRGRFLVDGVAYSDTSPSIAYQFDMNKATGSHKLWGMTGNLSAGAHTAYFQVRNVAGGTTWILNYWSGSDYFNVMYY